jgi:hypothetical protein
MGVLSGNDVALCRNDGCGARMRSIEMTMKNDHECQKSFCWRRMIEFCRIIMLR